MRWVEQEKLPELRSRRRAAASHDGGMIWIQKKKIDIQAPRKDRGILVDGKYLSGLSDWCSGMKDLTERIKTM
jgi:hypothetical protein